MNTHSVSLAPEVVVRELVSETEQRIAVVEAALAGLSGTRDLLDRLSSAVAAAQVSRHRAERPVLYTVTDAARLLALSRSRVHKLVATGEVGSVRIGAARRIPASATTPTCPGSRARWPDGGTGTGRRVRVLRQHRTVESGARPGRGGRQAGAGAAQRPEQDSCRQAAP
ncbi:MAG: helix-turn-helix domain-containing protein [Actinomycetota bacterium]|nr:helix-turn-helix domain-containing protein [Actinomycetota bacterium]